MMGFCSVIFSELLFFSMLVTFVLKICHLVRLLIYFYFSSGENKPSLRHSNPSSSDLEGGQRRREARLAGASPKRVTRLHSTVSHMHPSVEIKGLALDWESLPTRPVSPSACFPFRENIRQPIITTPPVNRATKGVLVYEKHTHSRSCPVTDSPSAVGLNHKKRPQASGLIVRHLTSS